MKARTLPFYVIRIAMPFNISNSTLAPKGLMLMLVIILQCFSPLEVFVAHAPDEHKGYADRLDITLQTLRTCANPSTVI